MRNGEFDIMTSRKNLISLSGCYKNDKLEGKGKMRFKDNTWLEGFFKSGALHGFCRHFCAKDRLTFLGMYKNGMATGTCWKARFFHLCYN